MDGRSNADGRFSACGSRYSNQRRVGPNHFMARQHEAPMPRGYMDTKSVGYVRTIDKDDVVSVISQAKSLLSDGRLGLSYNFAQHA